MDTQSTSQNTTSTSSNWQTYIETHQVSVFIGVCIFLFILYLAYNQHKKNKQEKKH